MSLTVIKAGLFDTIQDLGRPGHRSRGIPPSGAFDPVSMAIANALLGNNPGDAVLEITLVGGVYEAEVPIAIALAGAPLAASILSPKGSGSMIKIPQSLSLSAGDRLILGSSSKGARAYLAVRGGWNVPERLNSRSRDEPLETGERIGCQTSQTSRQWPIGVSFPDPEATPIRLLPGPEPVAVGFWKSARFRVSARSDRMGLRLEGRSIPVAVDPSRLSTPVTFGTIQVAGGQPLVLGPGSGTMGGYPMVAQVISADLPRLGQARPGSWIQFEPVGLEAARQLDREQRNRLSDLVLRITTRVGHASNRPIEATT